MYIKCGICRKNGCSFKLRTLCTFFWTQRTLTVQLVRWQNCELKPQFTSCRASHKQTTSRQPAPFLNWQFITRIWLKIGTAILIARLPFFVTLNQYFAGLILFKSRLKTHFLSMFYRNIWVLNEHLSVESYYILLLFSFVWIALYSSLVATRSNHIIQALFVLSLVMLLLFICVIFFSNSCLATHYTTANYIFVF